MTCIVGLVDKGVIYMGGDSVAVGGLSIEVRADPKVFVRGPMVFGFTSSFRMGQLLEHALHVPEQLPSKSDAAYLVTDFVDAVRALYRERGFMGKEYEREAGGTFLLGYREGLYMVSDDFQVGRSLHPFSAVGCGGDIALGALHATRRSSLKPQERVLRALEAAAEFSAGVRAPFTVVRLPAPASA